MTNKYQSLVICNVFGLRYMTKHLVSTKFAIDIVHLLSYCVILNYTVTELITGMALRVKFSIFEFLSIT